MAKKAHLFSKANYSITIKYGNDDLVIPPNAKKYLVEDTTLVGPLPPQIRKVDIEGSK